MKVLLLLSAAIVSTALAQRSFETPEAAVNSLIDAASTNNTPTLNSILGTGTKTVLTGGSPEQDKAERDEFASIARNERRLDPDPGDRNRMILVIGGENWPFPVPLVHSDAGWRFDASATQALEPRRLRANEFDAIEICAGYVGAQNQFAQQHRMQQYASSLNELGTLIPRAMVESSGMNPYHGYFFQLLKSQGSNAAGGALDYVAGDTMLGGFALVAWPAEYGVTGIHAFIVNQDGTVFQKDLGKPGDSRAVPVARYDPDPSWKPVY